MENPSSPLDTLRQLKEMLDSGALTPAEFEALKQRLVFMPSAPESAAPESGIPPAAPIVPTTEASEALVPPPSTPSFYNPNSTLPPVAAEQSVDALAFRAAPEPVSKSEDSADFSSAVSTPSYVEAETLTDDDAFEPANPPAERNSSLGLVLAIGAVLVFLAVVAYLGFTRRTTDEHISSISQTAADSLNTTIETGPQVAPLPTTDIVPETVRVAPTNPAPVIKPRPAAPVVDSVAPAVKSPVSDSSGNQ